MLNSLLKVAGFGVLFIVLLEVVARAEDSIRYNAPFLGHYHLEGIRDVDDRGTVRCASNARYKHFELGDHGFRYTRHIDSRPNDKAQQSLVWLGASEAFGLYETPGEDIANQLERRFATDQQNIDVVNASCFGLNVMRLQRLVESPVADMRPDMIALYPTPHFYLDLAEVHADQPKPNTATASGGFVSRLVTKSRDVIKAFLPLAVQDLIREYQGSRTLDDAGAGADELWVVPPADRLALFETHIRELLTAAKSTGARVALLTHANAFHKQSELNESLLQSWQKFYPRATEQVLIEFDAQANALMRRLAAEYSVTLIDVAERVAGNPADFADFSHFTDSGAAKVADELETWALAL